MPRATKRKSAQDASVAPKRGKDDSGTAHLSDKENAPKKQKTSKDSSAATKRGASESGKAQKSDEKNGSKKGGPSKKDEEPKEPDQPKENEEPKEPDQPKENEEPKEAGEPEERDVTKIPDEHYICFNRPQFDYEAENRALGGDALDEDELEEKFMEDYEKNDKIALSPATKHPDWKWITTFGSWKMFCEYNRRAKYCCPDRFDMDLYNDHEGWGLQELFENWMLAFDIAFKKKDEDDSRREMWSIISALGMWVNIADLGAYHGCEHGEKTTDLAELVGSALLTALASLDKAGELKADSTFKDLILVITEYLEWSRDIEDYDVEWPEYLAAYFKKAKLDASRGVGGIAKLIYELEDDNCEVKDPSGKDPWGWKKALTKYKKSHGAKIGGTRYDITKMSRKERADASFDGVDPLKDVSLKDLKEGNLDFA